MSHFLKIAALLLGSALLMFAGGLQGLLISIRGAEEGFALYALGLIGASWSVGYITGTLVVPRMVSRVGHIRAFSVMAAFATIIILLNLIFIEQISWIVLRAFSGFCFAGSAMIVESWLNEVTDNSRRGTTFATYMMANFVFSTAGQMIIAVTGVQGYLPFVIGAMGFALAVLPTALTASVQPRPLARAKLNLPLLFRTSPVAVFASLISGIAAGAFGTLGPVYGNQIGLDSATIAYLISFAIIVSAIGQIPFGKVSDLIDRRIVIVVASAMAAVAGLILFLFNPSGGVLLWAMFALYGLGANAVYPLAAAHANDYAKDGDFGHISSGLILLFGIGLAIGPLLGALAMSSGKPVALFLVTAGFHIFVALFSLLRMRLRASVLDENREPFQMQVAVKNTGPQTVVLDPRIEADDFLDETTEPGDVFSLNDADEDAPTPEEK